MGSDQDNDFEVAALALDLTRKSRRSRPCKENRPI